MLFVNSGEALETAFWIHRCFIVRLLQDDEVNHVEGTAWLKNLALELETFQAVVLQYMLTISSVPEVGPGHVLNQGSVLF